MGRFADFVAATFPNPSDLLARYFDSCCDAAATVGARLEELPELDGRRHYLSALNGERDKRHYYIGNVTADADGTAWPTVTFGTFKQGGATTYWKPRDDAWREFEAAKGNGQQSNAEARAGYAQRVADLQREAEQKKEAARKRAADGHAAAAAAAADVWAAARPCESHPYLSRKGVHAFGLRVATRTSRHRLWSEERGASILALSSLEGDLLVPMQDAAGNLCNLQRITAAGEKRFLIGGRKQGTRFVIEGAAGCIAYAEGYATGATVHQASGATVVVAFDAGNLANIASGSNDASILRLVAADNDANGAGQKAAEATALPYCMPPTIGHDWNDHSATYGLASVADALAELTKPAAPALPVFDKLADLTAVDLAGREQVWFNRLAKATEPADAAATAWAIARKLAIRLPVQVTLDELLGRIAETSALLHADTLTAMRRTLARWIDARRRKALSQVGISANALRRHQHELHDSLPELSETDYHGVILLWAPMASGKTQRIGRPFAKWAQANGRFIATCHRRSLVAEMAQRLDCWHYSDVDRENAFSIDALATCLPSITKAGHQQIMQECRFLFIDEIAQVLRFIESQHHCRTDDGTNADVFARLQALVRNAHCVIGADAGMDDRVIEFLESARPGERFRVVEVKATQCGLTVQHGYGDAAITAVYGEMLARLAEGERIWVSVESQKRVKEVAAILGTSGARVLAVTANNKGNTDQARFWESPETASRQYDAVVHSPVISSGLSIEHRDSPHFDHGFFIGGGHTITPADAIQMLRRVRYLRSWSVAFVANTMRGQVDQEAMLLGMEAAAVAEQRRAGVSSFDAFVAQIKADNNAARADFAAAMLWALERAGFALERLPEFGDDELAETIKNTRAELDAEHRQRIIDAADIDDEQANRLRALDGRTEDESNALTKHAIRRALGIEVVTEEALDVWDDGRGMRRLDRFSAAVLHMAERRDDAEHLSQARFTRARVKAYRDILQTVEIQPGLRITDELADAIICRVIENRYLSAWLGIVPAKFGAYLGADDDGNPKPYPMPKTPQKDVGEIFRAMNLALARRRNRWDGTKFYELDDATLAATSRWANLRNSPRSGVTTLDINTGSGTVQRHQTGEYSSYWHEVRRRMLALIGGLSAVEVEMMGLDFQAQRPPSSEKWAAAYPRADALPIGEGN